MTVKRFEVKNRPRERHNCLPNPESNTPWRQQEFTSLPPTSGEASGSG